MANKHFEEFAQDCANKLASQIEAGKAPWELEECLLLILWTPLAETSARHHGAATDGQRKNIRL